MSWDPRKLHDSLLIGSTLVEGSTLTEGEARKVLQGKTILGHPIHEIRELLNYSAATEWLAQQFKKSPYLSVDLILSFHTLLFQGFNGIHGRFKISQNFTYLSDGRRYDYASPVEVPDLVQTWVDQFNAKPISGDHNEAIARLYYEFQRIHPFEDGNGRIGRILCSYWLYWKFKMDLKFHLKDKVDHLNALESANADDFEPLILFFKRHTGKK